MDGTGQELLNAVLYFSVVLSVVFGLLILPLAFIQRLKPRESPPNTPQLIYSLFIIIVSFSVAREGSEIWIYLSGFANQTGDDKVLLNRAGMGYAWNDKIFTEVYLLTESITHEGEQIRGYEAELKWQITEQGEYWADWGLLLEAGTARDISSHEFAAGILWGKRIGEPLGGNCECNC